MKFQIVLRKITAIIKKITLSALWKKMFVHQIDEQKMRDYQNQHRLMWLKSRGF